MIKKRPAPLLTINGETLQAMNLDDACRYLEYRGTRNGKVRATKEVARQKIIAARDLIKCHHLTPELATELFTSKGMGIFLFSAALIEWSASELNDVKRLYIQAYKNAWHLSRSTASALFIFPKTHAGKGSTLPISNNKPWQRVKTIIKNITSDCIQLSAKFVKSTYQI